MSLNSVKSRSRWSGLSKKPCCLHQVLEPGELRFARPLSSTAFACTASCLSSAISSRTCSGFPARRDRLQHVLPAVRGRPPPFRPVRPRRAGPAARSGRSPGPSSAFVEPPGPVLQRAAQRVGARRQPALVQGHQEADGAGTGVVAVRPPPGAHCALHERASPLGRARTRRRRSGNRPCAGCAW